LSILRIIPVVRRCLLASGIIVVMIAGKVGFAGLGAGTFNITAWELVLLVVVGAALIVLGWQWPRRTGPDTNLEDGVSESITTEDEP
jgi:membrane protein implicated in regulation of membrane protease activity